MDHLLQRVIFIALITIIVSDSFSQTAPRFQWKKTYGGSGGGLSYSEVAWNIHQTFDGGYIVGGVVASTDGDIHGYHGGNRDGWVVKLNNKGDTVWTKCLGGSDLDAVASIIQTKDSGYIAALQTSSNDGDVSGNHGAEDYWIVKMDSVGKIQWKKCYGGTANDEVIGIIQNFDGSYTICGGSQSNNGDVPKNNGLTDIWVLKIDKTGKKIWSKVIGGSSFDEGYAIQQTKDSAYILVAVSNSNNGDIGANYGGSDYFVTKLSINGSILWRKNYGGTQDDNGWSILQTNDGGYCVAGETKSNDIDVKKNHNPGTSDYWIIKIDSVGTIKWQSSLGGSDNDVASGISLTKDGYLVCGSTQSVDGDLISNNRTANDQDYWVVKINGTGKLIWEKSMGGDNNDFAAGGEQTNDCGYIITGSASSYNTGDVTNSKGGEDWWIVKLKKDTVQYNVSVSVSPSTTICRGTIATFTVTTDDSAAVTKDFQWIKNSAPVGQNSNIYIDSALNDKDTIYCLVSAYCYTKTSNKLIITVNSAIKPTISASRGTVNVCPKYTDTLTANSSVAVSYLWNTSATTKSIAINTSGNFIVTITDANGCKSTSDTTKVVYQTCTNPKGLAVSNITSSSAKINWAADSCAVGYQYEWRIRSASVWTKAQTTSNSKTITGLSANTTYQWRVIKACRLEPDTLTSGYANGTDFHTLSFAYETALTYQNKNQFSLIPNPAIGNAKLTLLNSNEKVSIKVTDASGTVVWQTSTRLSNIIIPSQRFASGVYVVSIVSSKHVETEKLVKQ